MTIWPSKVINAKRGPWEELISQRRGAQCQNQIGTANRPGGEGRETVRAKDQDGGGEGEVQMARNHNYRFKTWAGKKGKEGKASGASTD